MNRPIKYLSIIVLLNSFASVADELDELAMESKKLVDVYSSQLQMEYDKAYATINFDAVREICRVTALGLAGDLNKDGYTIRRISMNPLNEQNIPDQTEKGILQDFITRQTKGNYVDKLSWYKLDEIGNQSQFRYIKAFTMEQRCMTCHQDQSMTTWSQNTISAYALKKIETKNYFPEEMFNEKHKPLPVFSE